MIPLALYLYFVLRSTYVFAHLTMIRPFFYFLTNNEPHRHCLNNFYFGFDTNLWGIHFISPACFYQNKKVNQKGRTQCYQDEKVVRIHVVKCLLDQLKVDGIWCNKNISPKCSQVIAETFQRWMVWFSANLKISPCINGDQFTVLIVNYIRSERKTTVGVKCSWFGLYTGLIYPASMKRFSALS